MPGAVGMIRLDGQPAIITAVLQKLCHFPTYQSEEIYRSQGLALGVVYCLDQAPAFDWHFDPKIQIGVLISGTMLATNPMPHVLHASEVLSEYQAHGFTYWDRFEGGFVVIIVDVRRNRVCVANDRLGQLPFYYASRPGVFVFAPEVKGVLVNNGFEALLSAPGIINFLSAGYCFGDLTLFEGVSALEPSTLLSVNLKSLATEKTRLWKMVYEPAPELNRRRAAEDCLFQTILDAHKTTLCDPSARAAVLLSGGWDSRGMLAALDRIHQPPQLALTWGLPEEIAHSDVSRARRLADAFGVPSVFIPFTTDKFIENAERWCYLSEFASENFGWCAQGAEVQAILARESFDVLLVGDEAWGRGGYVADEMEARAVIFAPRLPYGLRQILRESFVNDAEEMYNDAVLRISQPCENLNFVDRKDFMYVHGRMPRFLFPIRSQYRKEFALMLRRPFLSNALLEVIRRLPPQYRIHRNLYISMMRRHFPRAMAVPVSTTRANPNWIFDVRYKEVLKNYFVRLLDFDRLEHTPLGQLFDRPHFERLRDDFFSSTIRPLARNSSWLIQWKNYARLLVSRSPSTARMQRIIRNTAKSRSASTEGDYRILRRIALLSLLQEHLSALEQP
jgi:asparagine synthetase B (glutamine-hydrolysing)